jgi:hypothetical protein
LFLFYWLFVFLCIKVFHAETEKNRNNDKKG